MKEELKSIGCFLAFALYVGTCLTGMVLGLSALDEAMRLKVREG